MNIIETLSIIAALLSIFAAPIAIYEFLFIRQRRECYIILILTNIGCLVNIHKSNCKDIKISKPIEQYLFELQSLLSHYPHLVTFLKRNGISQEAIDFFTSQSQQIDFHIMQSVTAMTDKVSDLCVFNKSPIASLIFHISEYVITFSQAVIEIAELLYKFIIKKLGKIIVALIILMVIIYYFSDIAAFILGPLVFDNL